MSSTESRPGTVAGGRVGCRQQGAVGCGPNPAPPPVPRCKFPLGKGLKRGARHSISAQQIYTEGSHGHGHRNRIQRMFWGAAQSAALRCTAKSCEGFQQHRLFPGGFGEQRITGEVTGESCCSLAFVGTAKWRQ